MNDKSYIVGECNNTEINFSTQKLSSSNFSTTNYGMKLQDASSKDLSQSSLRIGNVAKWFLSKSSMSNKKLQKLCYYAYCWYIVFFNDVEAITENNENAILVLCQERFQAWVHGPVSPSLYRTYRDFGWQSIPKEEHPPLFDNEINDLLQQVWEAYRDFSAYELEALTHQETPWIRARKGIPSGEACSNEISPYDILQYYSSLE